MMPGTDIRLHGARNFRSLEGMATADGRRLARHMLLRRS